MYSVNIALIDSIITYMASVDVHGIEDHKNAIQFGALYMLTKRGVLGESR